MTRLEEEAAVNSAQVATVRRGVDFKLEDEEVVNTIKPLNIQNKT